MIKLNEILQNRINEKKQTNTQKNNRKLKAK